MSIRITTHKLLRIGVAFAFMYPAVSAWFDPFAWVGYFPSFVTAIVPVDPLFLLHIFGALEIAIALWILCGKRIFIPAFFASGLLSLIVVLNLNQMDVLFRDIPILLMSIALMLEEHKKNIERSTP